MFNDSVIESINTLIEEINAATVKRAEQANADPGLAGDNDPGGRFGPSSHPSRELDGGTRPARVGDRGLENTQDIKKNLPAGVYDGREANERSDYNQFQIGTKKTPTGEHPEIENSYKARPEDRRQGGRGGTSHPANAEEIGEKYSSMTFSELYKLSCDKINNVLAKIAVGEQAAAGVHAGHSAAKVAQQLGNPALNIDDPDVAAVAGYELAKLAQAFGTTPDDEAVIKFAAAQDVVSSFVADGYIDADLVGDYLYKVAQVQEELTKLAEEQAVLDQLSQEENLRDLNADETGGEPPLDQQPKDAEPTDENINEEEAVNELANAFIEAGIPIDRLIEQLEEAEAAQVAESDPQLAALLPEEVKASMARIPPNVRSDIPLLKFYATKVAKHLQKGKFRMTRPTDAKQATDRAGAVSYLNYVKEIFAL